MYRYELRDAARERVIKRCATYTYYLLLTTYNILLTTYYLQHTTYNLLLTTYSGGSALVFVIAAPRRYGLERVASCVRRRTLTTYYGLL